jgi:hypothetical protein
MSVTDPRFIERLNLCQQELMDEIDGLPGVVDRWLFRVNRTTGLVALPYTLDRLMQATVDGIPDMITSPWFEFVQYGPGLQDDYDTQGNPVRNWTLDIFDRGEMPVVTPIPDAINGVLGPWVLRVYAAVDENVGGVPPEMNVQGLDADGLIIRTTDGTNSDDYTGVNMDIDFAVPYTQGTQQFTKITSVVKPVTRGYVKLTAFNGSVEVELSNYAYNETAPSYRHYYIPRILAAPCLNTQAVILGRCHRRFVPVSEDNDPLIISNINALSCMFIAQWKRTAGDYAAYEEMKTQAIDILRKEAMAYLGKTKLPAMSVQKGFSLGSIPNFH